VRLLVASQHTSRESGRLIQSFLKLTATNPLAWVVVMGLVAVFVAYGRYALMPPA